MQRDAPANTPADRCVLALDLIEALDRVLKAGSQSKATARARGGAVAAAILRGAVPSLASYTALYDCNHARRMGLDSLRPADQDELAAKLPELTKALHVALDDLARPLGGTTDAPPAALREELSEAFESLEIAETELT